MLFSRAAGEGLEPVRVVRRTAVQGPFLHGMRHIASNGLVDRRSLRDRGEKLFRDVLGKIFPHRSFVENIDTVVVDVRSFRLAGPFDLALGYDIDSVNSIAVAHVFTLSCLGVPFLLALNMPP